MNAQPSRLSLLSLVRQRYLEAIRSVQPPSRWKTIVTDEPTSRSMLNVLKMYDILDESVQQVELISNPRSPNTRVEAIYFLAPTAENIDRIIRDFLPAKPAQAATKKAPAQPATSGPMYAAAHLFFIDSACHHRSRLTHAALHDDLLQRVANSPANDFLKTCQELFVNFWPAESRVFSMQNQQAWWSFYAPPHQISRDAVHAWDAELASIAARIVNVLITLGELPEVRCFVPPTTYLREPVGPGRVAGEHLAPRLAQKVHQALVKHAASTDDFPPIADPPRPRGILFVTDRTMDLFAPFLHEFTYQAMANDLMPIQDGSKYHYSFRNEQGVLEEKDAVLSDEDKVWTDVKHLHMKDASERLVDAFKQFTSEHGTSGSSINDLKDMLASLPSMQEAKEKLSLHLSLAEKCMNAFEQKKLPLTASVEQQCATGMTPQGKAPKTLVEEMVPLLDDPSVSRKDKVRIIALYVMHRDGVPVEDRKRLYQHARLGMPEVDAIDHLNFLGVEVTKDSKKNKRKPLFKQPLVEEAYDISRYQPAVRLMLEDHFAGKLDRTSFPYIGVPPPDGPIGATRSGTPLHVAPTAAPASLRSARPRWTAGTTTGAGGRPGATAREPPRQRVIVFMAGGMTYSEVRSAYQVSEQLGKDVIIGSTHLITPESFIDDLANIDRPPSRRTAPPSSTAPAFASVQPQQAQYTSQLAQQQANGGRPSVNHTNTAPAPDLRRQGYSNAPLQHASTQPASVRGYDPRSISPADPSPRPSISSSLASSGQRDDLDSTIKPKKKGLFSRK